jgi:ribulose bisphosphate carboxylase small subunit
MKSVNEYLSEGRKVVNTFYQIDGKNKKIVLARWRRMAMANSDTIEAIMAIETILQAVPGTYINSISVDGEIVKERVFYSDGSIMAVERELEKEEYKH